MGMLVAFKGTLIDRGRGTGAKRIMDAHPKRGEFIRRLTGWEQVEPGTLTLDHAVPLPLPALRDVSPLGEEPDDLLLNLNASDAQIAKKRGSPIIDPFFKGPISTALINFSDRPRRIDVGDRFFRVAFFKHSDVSAFHTVDESLKRGEYIKSLEAASFADFSPSFLNIPTFDDDYYRKKFWAIVFIGITKNLKVSIPLFIIASLVLWFLVHLGFDTFLGEKLTWLGGLWKKIKDVSP
jgi:hypothetical protein